MRVVLRIGGSVVATPINPELMLKYVELLEELKKQKHEVVVVVGGGELAREMISVARDMGLDEPAQDEIAISASRIFAQLFLKKLGKIGCAAIPLNLWDTVECLRNGKVAVMGGLKPGMTTDTVAALVAMEIRADVLVKATNQDGIYDKDPAKHSDAVKIAHLKIEDLLKVLSETRHKAGIHQIIDPEAVKILSRIHVKVVVVNGFNPKNVLSAVEGRPVGTIIETV
jgi:uridylate kinase